MTFEAGKRAYIYNANHVCHRIENMRNGENACIQNFLLFLQCFQEAFSSGSFKRQNCVVKDSADADNSELVTEIKQRSW